MKDDLVKKGLVFGIILLFIGIGIIPTDASVIREQCIEDTRIRTIFNQINHTLTIEIPTIGTVFIDIDSPHIPHDNVCIGPITTQIEFEEGTTLALTYMSAFEYEFTGWYFPSGPFDYPLMITMDEDKTVTANFKQENYPNCLGTLRLQCQERFIKPPIPETSWREDKHYFFDKLTANMARGNFSCICRSEWINGGPITTPDRISRFEITLIDNETGKWICKPFDIWFTVPGGENTMGVLIKEKVDFEDLKPEQNEMEVKVKFQGYGYPFGWLFQKPSPRYQYITVHFI